MSVDDDRGSAAKHAHAVELRPVNTSEIAPVEAAHRPHVSVILPVYEPSRAHFCKALHSVLQQDLGFEVMQIAVVDDASPTQDVAALLREVDPSGRVEHYRIARNQGLAGNWNQCIRVARGEVVHLLHQDDWVADGFYQRLLPAFEKSPQVGMAFSRYVIAEGENKFVRVSHREAWRAGVIKNWLQLIAEWQRIQCAAVLVRRSVYEQLGGYRSDLLFGLDWEMWVRIAARFDVWYEPKKLAYYRRHAASETQRLVDHQQSDMDVLKTIEVFSSHLPASSKEKMQCAAYQKFVSRAIKQLKKGTIRPGPHIVEQAVYLQHKLKQLPSSAMYVRRLSDQVAEFEQLTR